MAGENEKEDKVVQEQEDEEIQIVTDEDLLARAQGQSKSQEEEDSDDESDDDDEDERLAQSEDDDDDPKRRRERERRKRRKQRQRESRERRDRELQFYENWNAKLEREVADLRKRLQGTERVTIEGRISQLKAAIKKAEDVHAEAIDNRRGEDAAEALRIRDQFRENLERLEEAKKSLGDDASREVAHNTPEPPDPRVISRAERWVKRNDWFDPHRRNYESKIAGAIDDALLSEGFDPATDEYWEELDSRIKELFPDLGSKGKRQRRKSVNTRDEDFDDDDLEEEDRPRGPKKANGAGGPPFRRSSQTRGLQKGEYYLSRDRIEAMKEAGIWDDPVARAKMIKRYRDFDAQNSQE